MPEFTSFASYRSAAREFMGGGKADGVWEAIRADGDVIRLDPKSGYFGVRSQDGAIKTFFRPQPDPESYFRSQLGG